MAKIYQLIGKEREIRIRRKVNSWNEQDKKGGWKKKRQTRMIKKAAGS